MKLCTKCRRTYADETLNFSLDDGEWLVGAESDEPATAILSEPGAIATGIRDGEVIRPQIHTAGAEAEPRDILRNSSEKRSFSASRAAKPLSVIGVIALIVIGGYFGYRYFGPGEKQIDSIAVMPFENQSGNPDVEYLSDGMTETLINTLSQLPNLKVKPRSSSFRYKGRESEAKTIGKELNVRAVLNGRLVQRGDEITLFLSLIDTGNEDHLWGKQYSRKLANLVTLQTEVARDVSESLKTKLSGTDEQTLAKNYTANPEAYRLYLQGRYFWNKRRIAATGQAISYFQQAIDLDPNYALAWAGLADAVAQPSDVIPHPERAEKSRAAAVKALALDNDLAEAHSALAHILIRYDLDFAGAERELKLALDLDPKWVDTYQRQGELHTFTGKHDESFEKYRQGLELEPFNLALNATYGSALFYARRYDEAIVQLKKTLEMDPNFRNAHVNLGAAYWMKGMYPESVKHRVISLELAGLDQVAGRIRDGFAKGGWNGVLQAEYERFSYMERTVERASYFSEAAILTALGEKDKAFAALNKSFEAREGPALVFLKVEPRFDPLRDDPRFQDLLRKVGFPE